MLAGRRGRTFDGLWLLGGPEVCRREASGAAATVGIGAWDGSWRVGTSGHEVLRGPGQRPADSGPRGAPLCSEHRGSFSSRCWPRRLALGGGGALHFLPLTFKGRKYNNLISHVLLCNVTQRVSFWFVVTDPSRNHTLPAVEVQSAIRMNRNRINNAFFLNDQTLEFLRIPSTLAPPTDPSVPIWIIIFGVIFCIVIVATMLLILSGIRQRRRILRNILLQYLNTYV
eukprot:bmy_01271T0